MHLKRIGLTHGAEQVDPATGKSKTGMVKSAEDIQVDQVRLMGDGPGKPMLRVGIKLRYDRRPVVGDKFSSRHGQKGTLATLWPAHNMPFSENGITPDVIINPNAFPSRMTIGMLVESMAGKSGAMHGYFPDSTPFRFDEDNRAVDHFGHQLKEAGLSPPFSALALSPNLLPTACHSAPRAAALEPSQSSLHAFSPLRCSKTRGHCASSTKSRVLPQTRAAACCQLSVGRRFR